VINAGRVQSWRAAKAPNAEILGGAQSRTGLWLGDLINNEQPSMVLVATRPAMVLSDDLGLRLLEAERESFLGVNKVPQQDRQLTSKA
jgi:hypothetical protein